MSEPTELNEFFEWDIDIFDKAAVLEIGEKYFVGETVVIHSKEYNARRSWYLRFELIHLGHILVKVSNLRRGQQRKFMPQFPHYRIRRLVGKPSSWHISWVSSIRSDESTYPLEDTRGQ